MHTERKLKAVVGAAAKLGSCQPSRETGGYRAAGPGQENDCPARVTLGAWICSSHLSKIGEKSRTRGSCLAKPEVDQASTPQEGQGGVLGSGRGGGVGTGS